MPNHTSSRHAWFREALAAPPGIAARERYIFRDGLGPDGALPPSDWTSMFGGPAWTRVTDGQWYLHLFAAEQPDLNWENREVREDFLTTLRFWSDRGVDGFRVDVAHGLAKNLAEPLEPLPDRAADAGRTAGPSRQGPTRSGTGTRCTTSTPNGGRYSTSTTRRARAWPRHGSTRPGGRGMPAPPGWARPSTSTCSRPTGRRGSSCGS